ncbi:MAG TPA: hypothetical protein VE935_11405 [Burkholderiales bacterium]|nr:hypothetical protein [Burkholderiales bacterium]
MQVLLKLAARIAAVIGVVTMVIAVLGRAAGLYWFGGLQVGTVLQAGMAAVLLACLAYLALLVEVKAR